ncbi:C-X-C motif chemokine 6-like [Hemiscyllium ocellatum]|uniref:C-X-C motif chemokine 6-like n=1 Tax=Hemiscyllium ocellatum TaxID=170820 RepID=UPI002965F6EE|nr:C-X-C motif chemokine 6-like [Hemiscyllium ocellatum]
MMNCRVIFIILAILMLSGQLTDGRAIGAVKFDLRCHCIRSVLGIPRKYIKKLEIIPAGPHCAKVQIIATLRKGRKVCVNPKADSIKMIGMASQ